MLCFDIGDGSLGYWKGIRSAKFEHNFRIKLKYRIAYFADPKKR
jgi:hypothetical protein